MASRQSAKGEPQASSDTLVLNGVEGVVGTGGQVPARCWPAIRQALIGTDKATQKPRNKAMTSALNLSYCCHRISSDENSPTAATR